MKEPRLCLHFENLIYMCLRYNQARNSIYTIKIM